MLPVLGLAINVVAQIVLLRWARGRGFLRTIAVGFALGGLFTLVAYGFMATLMATSCCGNSGRETPLWMWLAEWLVMIAPAYAGLGYGYANFANLGNASIRIRLYEDLQRAPGGLRLEEIHRTYNERAILENRLHRLTEGGDLHETQGRWTVARRRFVVIGGLIFAAKRFILGRRSEFDDASPP
jgi:hypothetical protein